MGPLTTLILRKKMTNILPTITTGKFTGSAEPHRELPDKMTFHSLFTLSSIFFLKELKKVTYIHTHTHTHTLQYMVVAVNTSLLEQSQSKNVGLSVHEPGSPEGARNMHRTAEGQGSRPWHRASCKPATFSLKCPGDSFLL